MSLNWTHVHSARVLLEDKSELCASTCHYVRDGKSCLCTHITSVRHVFRIHEPDRNASRRIFSHTYSFSKHWTLYQPFPINIALVLYRHRHVGRPEVISNALIVNQTRNARCYKHHVFNFQLGPMLTHCFQLFRTFFYLALFASCRSRNGSRIVARRTSSSRIVTAVSASPRDGVDENPSCPSPCPPFLLPTILLRRQLPPRCGYYHLASTNGPYRIPTRHATCLGSVLLGEFSFASWQAYGSIAISAVVTCYWITVGVWQDE